MNDEFHTYLKKAGDETRLSESERARMRGVLSAYMEMKPVRTGTQSSASGIPGIQWFYAPRPFAAALVLVLFVSSAGISYAAQGALPGDALYSVKIHINEPVSGALALSSSAKAEWAMGVAGERLEEAATLAAEGRLSTTAKADLQENFESHATLAIHNIGEEADASPDTGGQSALRFEAQLSEYGRVLSEVGGTQDGTDSFVVAVRSQEGKAASIRMQSEERTIASSSPEKAIAASRMRDAAKHQLDDSVNLARNAGPALASSSAHIVAEGLDGASTTISDGEVLLDRNATLEALGVFRGALSAAEKLGVFLQTSSAIHKRTGRVISEPKEHSVSSAKRKGGEGEATATLTQAAQPVSVSATMMATTTVDVRTETRDSDNSRGDGGEKSGDEGESGKIIPTLPITAPSSFLR